VRSHFEAARRARVSGLPGSKRSAAREYEQAIATYDFDGLFEVLSELHRTYPDESRISISARGDIPIEMVQRVMDTAAGDAAAPMFVHPAFFVLE
jgi:hypothetical protein